MIKIDIEMFEVIVKAKVMVKAKVNAKVKAKFEGLG